MAILQSTGRVVSERVARLLAEQMRIAVTDDGEISSGYDGIVRPASMNVEEWEGYELSEIWTADERAELARIMIERWARYGELPRTE